MNCKKETDEIKIRKKLAKKQGGSEAVALQHAKGRLTLRERIDKLIDKDSFQEQGEIAGGSETNEKGEIQSLTPANFILGFAKINGRSVVIGGEEKVQCIEFMTMENSILFQMHSIMQTKKEFWILIL